MTDHCAKETTLKTFISYTGYADLGVKKAYMLVQTIGMEGGSL